MGNAHDMFNPAETCPPDPTLREKLLDIRAALGAATAELLGLRDAEPSRDALAKQCLRELAELDNILDVMGA